MSKENYGVHISHCCYIHGCKYGDKDCPVQSGEVAQKYICYDCQEECEPYTIEEIERLRKAKSHRPTYKQLQNQLALTEKALELACEELGKVEVFDKEFMECESFYDYFKTKAKELKSE